MQRPRVAALPRALVRLASVRGVLVLGALLCVGCPPAPRELEPDEIRRRDVLTERLDRDASDVEAATELADLYALHLDFAAAEHALERPIVGARLGSGDLSQLADALETLSRKAESIRRREPGEVELDFVQATLREADRIRARADFTARLGEPTVTATAIDGRGERVLEDAMLHCVNDDFIVGGDRGGDLSLGYFGDRISVSTPPGRHGVRDLEYRLVQLDRMVAVLDADLRPRWTLVPSARATNVPRCDGCTPHDPCRLLGNGPAGGLEEVELLGLSEVRFRLGPPRSRSAAR